MNSESSAGWPTTASNLFGGASTCTKQETEGWCDGGTIFSDGRCSKKRSLDETCHSGDDNNECVTRRCHYGTCVRRDGGCANFWDCTGIEDAGSSGCEVVSKIIGAATMPNLAEAVEGRMHITAIDATAPGAFVAGFSRDGRFAGVDWKMDAQIQRLSLDKASVDADWDEKRVELNLPVDVGMSFTIQFDLGASVSSSETLTRVLMGCKRSPGVMGAAGVGICNPLLETCRPCTLMQITKPVGPYVMTFEIGVQLTTTLTVDAFASASATVVLDCVLDGKETLTAGFCLDCDDEPTTSNASSITPRCTPTLSTEMEMGANFTAVIGPEIVVSMNGVKAYAGLNGQVDASAVAKYEGGCLEEHVAARASIVVGLSVPAVKFSVGSKQECIDVLTDMEQAGETGFVGGHILPECLSIEEHCERNTDNMMSSLPEICLTSGIRACTTLLSTDVLSLQHTTPVGCDTSLAVPVVSALCTYYGGPDPVEQVESCTPLPVWLSVILVLATVIILLAVACCAKLKLKTEKQQENAVECVRSVGVLVILAALGWFVVYMQP